MNTAPEPRVKTRRFWTGARLALTLITGLLIAAVGASSCSRSEEVKPATETAGVNTSKDATAGGAKPTGSASPASPSSARYLSKSISNTEIKGLDGKTFRLSDYAGKVIILDLWATWCPPCRDEIPELVGISKEYASKGLVVVGLDVDPRETAQKVQDFADEFQINYKLGWADQDLAISLMLPDNGAIPQTLVIGRDGRILEHFVGFHPIRTAPKMRRTIEQAISGGAGAGGAP